MSGDQRNLRESPTPSSTGSPQARPARRRSTTWRAGAEMGGIEMEEISTLLSLLPAARGSNDVSGSARYLEPNDEQPDELPLRAAPQLTERVCTS